MISCNKTPPAPLPTANFYVENNGCSFPCYVYFYSNSINAESLKWRFGNGLTSNQSVDSSQYIEDGPYEVWLVAINSDGVKDSVRKTIWVN
ncbi:MAG: PKD domain-containing protein [Crocinitomicaceae bacterium]